MIIACEFKFTFQKFASGVAEKPHLYLDIYQISMQQRI